MTQRDFSAEEAGRQVMQATRQAVDHPWFAYLARFGYASKGVVYLLAGGLSARAAFGLGGRAAGKDEALRTVLYGPFGQVMLALLAVGIVGYVLLRFVQAFLDPERKGTGAKGVTIRAGFLISGLLYAALAWSALRLVLGADDGAGDPAQRWAAWAFGLPLGRWLVGVAGAVVIVVGLAQLYKSYTADFTEHFYWERMSAAERRWATYLGRVGLAARGVVFALIGTFAVQAALAFDASKAHETGGALAATAEPLGPLGAGVVAVGLVAYGIYMLAAGRYGRIVTR